MLRQRFRGALSGVLVGDCFGAYWESKSWKGVHPLVEIKQKMEDQLKQTKSKKAPLIYYTDDTALTLALGDSIMECKKFDARHFAHKLSDVYYEDPRRCYGQSVTVIFYKLKNRDLEDVFAPAREQFDGQGSCGNGSAMRVAPAALLGFKDDDCLVKVCEENSKITHSHLCAVNFSKLQGAAVKFALEAEQGKLDPVMFVDRLCAFIEPHEPKHMMGEMQKNRKRTAKPMEGLVKGPLPELTYIQGQPTCTSKLQQIKALLLEDEEPSADVAQQILGHGIIADEAVSCAIYAFLIHVNKSFEELIPYAISLGGDTDTIASMAGALGGAYFGFDKVPKDWVDSCEGGERIVTLADSLFDLVNP